MVGKVVTWDANRGFGYLAYTHGGRERRIFLHRHGLCGATKLTPGQTVRFEIQANGKLVRAVRAMLEQPAESAK